MRVLVVTSMYPTREKPLYGVFVSEQVEALRAHGVEVDVLLVGGAGRKLSYLKGLLKFWAKIISTRYDIIHAHYVYAGWVARMQFGIPVVVTSHGSDTLGFECRLLRMLRPLVGAVTITSKQNQVRSGLQNTYLLPCGVDTDLFKPEDQMIARDRLGWDRYRKVMLYVGNHTSIKRVDLIKAAHEIVARTRSDVDLFLASDVDHRDIPTYLNAADVLVFASETEGAPVSIKEAAVCNLPIVSVDVGDVVEVIGEIDGCLVRERTADALAEGVLRVLDRGTRIDGNAVVEKYGKQATVDRILNIYNQVRGS